MEIDQPDLDAIERADRKKIRRKIKKLIRNIVNTTEGLTVNDQITLQDINFPEPNIALPLQLPPNVNVIVNEITNNVLTKISPKALLDLPEPETLVIDTDIGQGLDTETIILETIISAKYYKKCQTNNNRYLKSY